MCTFCAGGLKQSETEYIEKAENHIVLIKDVPCEKCSQCGETYFSHNIVMMIEDILNRIQCNVSSEIALTVIDYNKNAV